MSAIESSCRIHRRWFYNRKGGGGATRLTGSKLLSMQKQSDAFGDSILDSLPDETHLKDAVS